MNEEMAEYQTELLSTVSAMRDELDIALSVNEQTTELLDDAQAKLSDREAKLAELDQTKGELSIAKKKQATAEENVKVSTSSPSVYHFPASIFSYWPVISSFLPPFPSIFLSGLAVVRSWLTHLGLLFALLMVFSS
jgi:hypothetical protein